MAIKLKRPQHIAVLREANRLVAETFVQLEEAIRPGVRLSRLDEIATAYITSKGAKPLYKGYRGNPPTHPPFPGTICASVNEEICHGLPDKRRLHDGDVIGIDIGLRYEGWCGDACVTFAVGDVSPEAQKLMDVTKECLHLGIEAARPGARLTDIGAAIEAHAESHGYSVVREWGGHGVGRSLHEQPSVPHVGPGGRGPRLRPGMVFTIEPMINAGGAEWRLLEDGWTVVTADGALSAQFEHTIAITEDGPLILSEL
ncbi:MAG: type I methionyl aminopeptidase [Candidatus Promineifilaceae bacterium]|nr:type I methionyl aminopeptidase [Candidatus Promineifilaceae bacterium]